jgi:hypothetical protein
MKSHLKIRINSGIEVEMADYKSEEVARFEHLFKFEGAKVRIIGTPDKPWFCGLINCYQKASKSW